MNPTTSPPSTGMATTQRPRWCPTGESIPGSVDWKNAKLEIAVMRRRRAAATAAPATPMTTAMPERSTTRRSVEKSARRSSPVRVRGGVFGSARTFSFLVCHCPEREPGDDDAEILAADALHEVGPLHGPFEAVEDAEAVVVVVLSGGDDRLLADDPFPFDLFEAPARMVDVPVPAEELDVARAVVLDADEIREDELPLHGVGLVLEIDGPDADRDVCRRRGVSLDEDFHALSPSVSVVRSL